MLALQKGDKAAATTAATALAAFLMVGTLVVTLVEATSVEWCAAVVGGLATITAATATTTPASFVGVSARSAASAFSALEGKADAASTRAIIIIVVGHEI